MELETQLFARKIIEKSNVTIYYQSKASIGIINNFKKYKVFFVLEESFSTINVRKITMLFETT